MQKQARVVIVGGGVSGLSALYHLTLEGWIDVVLLERDELTSGTTWHSAAQCPVTGLTQKPNNEWIVRTDKGDIAIESMRLEKGYGHWKADLITEFNPIEAGLQRFVDLNKDFLGKAGLQAQLTNGQRKTRVLLDIDSENTDTKGHQTHAPNLKPHHRPLDPHPQQCQTNRDRHPVGHVHHHMGAFGIGIIWVDFLAFSPTHIFQSRAVSNCRYSICLFD